MSNDENTTIETDLSNNNSESTNEIVDKSDSLPENDGRTALGVTRNEGIKNLDASLDRKSTKPVIKTDGKVEVPQYTPNFKFKVLDQEKEMDEWARPFVKSKEMEDKFRDLYTKAHGLTKIKAERDGLKTEYDNFKTSIANEYAPIVQTYKNLSQLSGQARQSGDWGQFFQAAQIPVQSVIKWAANTVAQLEKDPSYLDRQTQNWNTHQNLSSLEMENRTLKSQIEREQARAQEVELNYTLQSPDIQDFSKEFDARVGTPGAFRQEVIRRGALIETYEKRVATAQEIVQELMKYYGGVPKVQNQSFAPQEQAPEGGNFQAQQGSEGKPVLPNVKGRSTSPAKTQIRSTDDLRKLRTSRAAS